MARSFASGSEQYLTNASFGGFSGEPFTLACWFQVADLDTNLILMSVGEYAGSGTYYHALYRLGTNNRLNGYTYDGSSQQAVYTTSTPAINTWYHSCAVFAADDDRRVYLDGDRGTDSTDSAAVGTDSIAIGVSADSTPFGYHNGLVAEAAAWNVALTDEEAAILAEGYSPLLVRPQSLVFYCPLIRDDDEDLVGGAV